jgi:serine/threonine protein phosphatase 1
VTISRRVRIFTSRWELAPGHLDRDVTVYAIGDVHGQLDHLTALIQWLRTDALSNQGTTPHLVTLGDYVDRGSHGLAVLEYLHRIDIPGVAITRLFGNHDLYLNTFLYDPTCNFDFVEFWISNGGNATLREFSIDLEEFYRYGVAGLRAVARERLSASAGEALAHLKPATQIGTYLFVHAGVHPERAFDSDDLTQLTTIREPFLSANKWTHDFVVVHGHSICGPDVRPHRIAVDSGAFLTGVLTCVQLKRDQMRFIAATQAATLDALAQVPGRRKLDNECWTEQE